MDKKDIAAIGYENAIALWIHYSEESWSRFSLMVTTNSITKAAYILFVTTNNPSYKVIQKSSYVILLISLVLNFLWLMLAVRSVRFSEYFIFSARELEEEHFGNIIKTIKRGGDFACGKKVKLNIAQKYNEIRLSRIEKWFTAKKIIYTIIIVFIIFDLILLLAHFDIDILFFVH